jgi:hypothetical protein
MSARFFKIFLAVCLVHLVSLSAIWVGFSAPNPRPPVTFTYEGGIPAEDTGSRAEDVWPQNKTTDQFVLDHFEASYFNHWIALRDPSKSFAYDHLGF